MTEDMVSEQEKIFASLGTSEDARFHFPNFLISKLQFRKIRMKMQAASLFSGSLPFS
jgi:hypothetical protein